MYRIAKVRSLKHKQLRAKKRLGQNFLYDPAIAKKIIASTGLGPGDTVIELGAGRGIMTRALIEKEVRLIALEVDTALYEQLNEEFKDFAARETYFQTRAEILNVDFTKISLNGLLAARNLDGCTLVGNIPYNLTRDVLFLFLVDEREVINAAHIMVQKEVGERIVSPPGSRVYGITSVVLQTLYDVKIAAKVAPGSFTPRPKVASVVLAFKPLGQSLIEPAELGPFVKLVKNLFQQRRKTIYNTLRSFYSLSETTLEGIADAAGIDMGARPEELSKETFISLSRHLIGAKIG